MRQEVKTAQYQVLSDWVQQVEPALLQQRKLLIVGNASALNSAGAAIEAISMLCAQRGWEVFATKASSHGNRVSSSDRAQKGCYRAHALDNFRLVEWDNEYNSLLEILGDVEPTVLLFLLSTREQRRGVASPNRLRAQQEKVTRLSKFLDTDFSTITAENPFGSQPRVLDLTHPFTREAFWLLATAEGLHADYVVQSESEKAKVLASHPNLRALTVAELKKLMREKKAKANGKAKISRVSRPHAKKRPR